MKKNPLTEYTSFVGAYYTVPRSAMAGAFDGWGRKLEWLLELVQFRQKPTSAGIAPLELSKTNACSGAEAIRYLQDATHTGCLDIEVFSSDLVKVAETPGLTRCRLGFFTDVILPKEK